MRESASRGIWVSSYAPFGYNRVGFQDGAKKRPTLEPDPDASRIVKRIFDMGEDGNGMVKITKTLNDEGILDQPFSAAASSSYSLGTTPEPAVGVSSSEGPSTGSRSLSPML